MTRNEALKKVNAIESSRFDEDIVNSLEALGLIKFDEEKIKSSEEIMRESLHNSLKEYGAVNNPHFVVNEMRLALGKNGYIIARKGD